MITPHLLVLLVLQSTRVYNYKIVTCIGRLVQSLSCLAFVCQTDYSSWNVGDHFDLVCAFATFDIMTLRPILLCSVLKQALVSAGNLLL